MVKSTIRIPRNIYHNIHRHLFKKKAECEEVAFIFATAARANKSIQLQFKTWYPVQSNEYEYQSLGYVELKDEMRPKIIKMAFDLHAAIIELHSHPFQEGARFSHSDFQGFDDFVPHVFWRLKEKSYAAVVFSNSDFDGLVWIDDPKAPQQLTEIIVGKLLWKRRFYPNGLTLRSREREYES